MRLMRSLPNKRLASLLVGKAVDTKLVQPQWGLWSLTTEELENDKRFHQVVAAVGGFAGISFSATSARDLFSDIKRKNGVKSKHVATVVIWVAFLANYESLMNTTNELNRRTERKSSSFYK